MFFIQGLTRSRRLRRAARIGSSADFSKWSGVEILSLPNHPKSESYYTSAHEKKIERWIAPIRFSA
jgi:hypothetical protein